jgi:hypothetical protein
MTLKLLCHLQEVEQLVFVEIGNRDEITFFHYSGLYIVEILMLQQRYKEKRKDSLFTLLFFQNCFNGDVSK